jgi:hypothetical protein
MLEWTSCVTTVYSRRLQQKNCDQVINENFLVIAGSNWWAVGLLCVRFSVMRQGTVYMTDFTISSRVQNRLPMTVATHYKCVLFYSTWTTTREPWCFMKFWNISVLMKNQLSPTDLSLESLTARDVTFIFRRCTRAYVHILYIFVYVYFINIYVCTEGIVWSSNLVWEA